MGKSLFQLIAALIAASLFSAGTAHARYLQTDPIGYEDDVNLYAYVANDPINKVDPNGKQALEQQYILARTQSLQDTGATAQEVADARTQDGINAATTMSIIVPLEGLIVKASPWLARTLGITSNTVRMTPKARSLAKSVRSLSRNVKEHKQKLAAYKKNPDKFDNKGMLKGVSKEVREKRIQGRIKALEGQIKRNEGELKKAQAALKRELEK